MNPWDECLYMYLFYIVVIYTCTCCITCVVKEVASLQEA